MSRYFNILLSMGVTSSVESDLKFAESEVAQFVHEAVE